MFACRAPESAGTRLSAFLRVANPEFSGHHALELYPGARVDAINRRDLQFLSLRTAAAMAHIQLAGAAPTASETEATRRVLDDVAHAIAILSPVYAKVGAGIALIDDAALIAGRFKRGASALVHPDGSETTGLMVQRRDLDKAVSVLRGTSLPARLRAATTTSGLPVAADPQAAA